MMFLLIKVCEIRDHLDNISVYTSWTLFLLIAVHLIWEFAIVYVNSSLPDQRSVGQSFC